MQEAVYCIVCKQCYVVCQSRKTEMGESGNDILAGNNMHDTVAESTYEFVLSTELLKKWPDN